MQYVGFFGIYKESFKIINSWKKIFSQITLLFIFPLTFTFLAHQEVSDLLFPKIYQRGYGREYGSRGYSDHAISVAWIQYWLFKVAYFTFLTIFSLLSTAAVVYTIACIYTAQVVTFKKVLKVWKRLIVTFLSMFLAFFIYNAVASFVGFIWMTIISDSTFGTVVFIVIIILYFIGFIYMTIIWQLASVVTVLETNYGLKAMMKANDLMKGKKWVAIGIFFTLNCFFVGLQIVFAFFFVNESVGMFVRIAVGLGCLLLLLAVFLFGLVIQTLLYLVCMSYHSETIDKLKLSDQLDGYLGEYEVLFKPNKNVQIGQAGQSQGVHIGQSQV